MHGWALRVGVHDGKGKEAISREQSVEVMPVDDPEYGETLVLYPIEQRGVDVSLARRGEGHVGRDLLCDVRERLWRVRGNKFCNELLIHSDAVIGGEKLGAL
eukprot:scaffold128593_cov32-Tisochrysis_lutea.AAC.1